MAGKTHWIKLAEEAKIHLLKVLFLTCHDSTAMALATHHDREIKQAFKFLEKEGMVKTDRTGAGDPYWYQIVEEHKKHIDWYYG